MTITLLGAHEIREIATSLDLHPAKSLGQNFVIDANTCQKIVRLAVINQGDHVVEIGPGLGSLTLALLQATNRVTVIEIDQRLAQQLPKTLHAHGVLEGSLNVINQDAMKVLEIPNAPTKLVANLPYNVSVPVLLTFLERFPTITSGVVMVQTEVAERLAAKPGSKVYGVPSAKAAWWCDMVLADSVSRSVFWPIPNVDSSLVKFVRHEPLGDESLRRITFDLIDRAFGQRRKMLRAIYSDIYGSSVEAENALASAGIDPTSRGESLSVERFAAIAKQLDRR
ncbi:MAG: 16S rRNA (adenine(1518)-N(6)/adenine(1519)-N(6))-dimethyltransferase RsmA [Actinomycetota bacterium]